jgi:antitoxin component YwqK of YwqJK toxin-antitoxin module
MANLFCIAIVLIAEINYLNDKKHGLSTRDIIRTAAPSWSKPNTSMADSMGATRSIFYTGSSRTEGDYDYNKRTGYWVNYYHTTGEISSEGNYEKGKKHGEWKFYDSKGQIEIHLHLQSSVCLLAKNGVSLEELKKQET